MRSCFLFLILLLLTPLTSLAYSTDCIIKNGRAYGYVTPAKYSHLTIQGNVKFIFLDDDLDEIDTDTTYEYEYVTGREEIEDVRAPRNAYRCIFDVSHATDAEPTSQSSTPSTGGAVGFCEVRNGVASVYVKPPKFESVTVSGYITVHFYDEDGDEEDKETDYVYAYTYNDAELVEEYNVDDDIYSCSVDLSEAL